MDIPVIVYVLVAQHLVGDWFLQPNWMALNKSKDNDALTCHACVVGAVLGIALAGYYFVAGDPPARLAAYIIVNTFAHWVTDYVTSRGTAKNWFVTARIQPSSNTTLTCALAVDDRRRFWFWRIIGTDQFLHYVTLFATAEWLL